MREERPHGTLARYRNGCRCNECIEVRRIYRRTYYAGPGGEKSRAASRAWKARNRARYLEYNKNYNRSRRDPERTPATVPPFYRFLEEAS